MRLSLVPQLLLLWLAVLPTMVVAAGGIMAVRVGQTVAEALRVLQSPEFGLIYTSELVPDRLTVERLPASGDPEAVTRALLAPHGLALQRVGASVFAVVRAAPAENSAAAIQLPTISEVVISASRYQLRDGSAPASTVLAGAQLKLQPGLGEDALRGMGRVPGVVQNSLSAGSYVRGGDRDETLVLFDGFPLRQAYHLPGYQSLFSVLDPALIATAEVFTGGFPARYGDRMSGVFDLQSVDPGSAPRHALGLGFFNASARAGGSLDGSVQGDWLAMARSGTLRTVISAINPEVGLPSYGDVFGRVRLVDRGDNSWSLNGLYSRDELSISDARRGESGQLESRVSYLWLRGEQQWGERLSLDVWFGNSQIDTRKDGILQATGVSGEVRDARHTQLWDLRGRAAWLIDQNSHLEAGIEVTRGDARYDYTSAATYELPIALLFNQSTSVSRAARLHPRRQDQAVFVSYRWRMVPRLATELGLRAQSIAASNEPSLELLDPRVALRWSLGSHTLVRFSWGQFHQQDGLNELRVEDGISAFGLPQQSNHVIAGLEHTFNQGPTVRIEAFAKLQQTPRARFENQLNNFLVILPELAPDRVRIAPDHSELHGMELSAESMGHPWTWWASYVWSRTFDEISGVHVPRAWDQRHAFSGGVEWERGAWSGSAVASVHSGWPTSQVTQELDGSATLTPRNSERLDTFASLDLRGNWQRSFRPGNLTVSLELSNALDRDNPCCRDLLLSEDGSGNVQMATRQLHWLPLLPALSVLWEF